MKVEALDSTSMFVMALLSGACFAVVYRIPRRYFLHATLLAMIARMCIFVIGAKTQLSFATFVASFIVGAVSHLFARTTGKPAQAFLIPGVISMVPGTSLSRAFSAALIADYTQAYIAVGQALSVTAAISFALLLANWVIPSKRML